MVSSGTGYTVREHMQLTFPVAAMFVSSCLEDQAKMEGMPRDGVGDFL